MGDERWEWDSAATAHEPALSSPDYRPVRPPLFLLIATGSCVAVSLLGFLATQSVAHLVGYFLGSLVAIGFASAFRKVDLARRTTGLYSPVVPASRLLGFLLFIGLLSAAGHAWYVARFWAT